MKIRSKHVLCIFKMLEQTYNDMITGVASFRPQVQHGQLSTALKKTGKMWIVWKIYLAFRNGKMQRCESGQQLPQLESEASVEVL